MSLLGLRSTIGDLRRLREIMGVLFEEGVSFVSEELRLRRLVPWRSRLRGLLFRKGVNLARFGANVEPPVEVRLRCAFERLGPSFVKLGQILSMRPDLLPEHYCAEFSRLQDRVPPLRPGTAERIVEDAIGQPMENVFVTFETEPIAAASLAVVHRATLRDGTPVAIKVRRPRVVETIRNDTHILAYLAALIEKHVPESRRLGPKRFVREFADWTTRELNFEIEGASMERFRAAFADNPSLVVPRVHWEMTRPDVLVMDYVAGIRIDDFAALDRAGIDRRRLAEVGIRMGLRQFFIEGFFHADPHPGNLVAIPGKDGPARRRPVSQQGSAGEGGDVRVCLYDFGMTGNLSSKSRYELMSCFMSYVNRDIDAYAGHVLDIAEPGPSADVDAFLSDAKRIVTDILYRPNERKGVALAFYRVLLAGARHDVRFPTDLILMAKAFFTLEQIGFKLCPDIDLDEIFRPALTEIMRRELSPAKAARDLQSSAFDQIYLLKSLPEKARAILERIERGEVGVKVDLDELHDLKAEFDRQNDARLLAVLVAVLFLGSAAVARLDVNLTAAGIPLGQIGFIASFVVLVWLIAIIRRGPR
jgi:ubiquinone biosynthesis protein